MAPIYNSFSGISQLFYVSDETGIFLTSVDIYFQNKDDFAPVTLQLRTTAGGLPGNTIVPFSEVTLDPDQVSVSTDASEPTNFKFSSPVYLTGPLAQEIKQTIVTPDKIRQYAIVLLTNSKNYKVFTARQGENSIITNTEFNRPDGNVGSLLKSQNASTWIPSPIEYLKYSLYRADFDGEGLVRFFNTKSSLRTGTVTATGSNRFLPLSKKIVVGLGSTGLRPAVSVGATITQGNASGTLTSIGSSIIQTSINNVGTGYTDGVFNDITLINESGSGQGAKANIGIYNSGITTVNITDGGFGYSSGDVLSIGTIGQDFGFGGKLIVSQIGPPNSLVLSDVQKQFNVGVSTVYFINSSGISTTIGVGVTISSIINDQYNDGLHMKVIHPSHGMHSQENYVQISKFKPKITDTHSRLTSNLLISQNTIDLESSSGFETFEGLPVDSNNLGYAIIGEEVVSYSGVSNNTLTGVVRSIDGTKSQPFNIQTFVYKYEFNGISLRRINKVHNFADVNVDTHPIDLDSYFIKIDMASSGKNRSNDLFFKETILSGQSGTNITQNIQFELFTTAIKNIIHSKTNITSRVRTTTATSVSGNENSFEDSGYQDFTLNRDTYVNSPRLIASSLNEQRANLPLPGNRSFEVDLYMSTGDSRLSPVIDIQDAGVLLRTSRINNPVTDFANDDRVRNLYGDPHESVYISKIISLKIPANSIKVLLTASQSIENDIRVFYRLIRPDVESVNYEPFPGFSNYQVGQDGIRRVVDPSKNDGSADFDYVKDSDNSPKDYEYTVDDLPDFTAFSIKIVMNSRDQSKPSFMRTLRVIANRKPTI